MKKALFFLFFIIFAGTVLGQNKSCEFAYKNMPTKKASQSEWVYAENFTTTDIYGVEHDLQSYLDAGKYVIIDFSCAWCAPCWGLHQSGVLDSLYNTYGPNGSDELQVLWVDIETENTVDQLYGISGSTGAEYTQGDWTEGGTWPVPIIDDVFVLYPFFELYGGGVPCVFLVCPSGYYTNVTAEIVSSAYETYQYIFNCPTENNDIVLNSITTTRSTPDCSLGNNENVIFEISNMGVDNVSGIEVSYSINNGPVINETIEEIIAPFETYTYQFTHTEDLSQTGIYEIAGSISWPEDNRPENNTKSIVAISGDSELSINIVFDEYSSETSWDIVENSTGTIVAESPEYATNETNTSETICILSSHCYTFNMYDSYGDGIGEGGYYSISVNGNLIANSAGNFDFSESTDVSSWIPAENLPDLTFCPGETITWSPDLSGEFSVDPEDINNSVPGITTVLYTINSGTACEATRAFNVEITDSTMDIHPDDISICQGESINLEQGNGSYYPAPSTIDNFIPGTTSVTYTVNEGLSCESSVSFDVTVNSLPAIDIYCKDIDFCVNNTITLPSGSGTFYPESVDNSVTGTTHLTYTTETPQGCTNSCSFNVHVHDDILDITPADMTICQGDPIVFEPGEGSYDPIINSSTPGTTTVTYTINEGLSCENSTDFDITVLSAPEITITQDGSVLSTTSQGKIQWYLNDQPIDQATGSSYTCENDGNYYAIVSYENGCSTQSNTITVTGTDIELLSKLNFSIYPNPADISIFIETPVENADIRIYNITGELVIYYSGFNGKTIDISTLNPGVYFIELTKDKQSGIKKLLIK